MKNNKPNKELSDDWEIIDEENYTPEGENQFSHQGLVMKTMNKCIEAGCKEMRPGYFNIRTDNSGNTIKVYVEDSRKEFIENVETLEMVMVCDLDEEAQKVLEKIDKELKLKYKELCKEEEADWDSCPASVKRNRIMNGVYYKPDSLSKKLPYYEEYIEEQVKAARRKFKELTKLSKRLFFYEEQSLEM